MPKGTVLISSLVLMVWGLICLALFQGMFETVIGGSPDLRQPMWLVPVGYFSLLAGAALLCWAWFRRNRI